MKILTVEDNDINAMLMDRLLGELSFNVEHDIADNGNLALEKVEGNDFDLVLMDINLGDEIMDGTDVMKALREKEHYKHVPIYAITCYALPGDKERFLEQGFNKYFSKPLNHQLLLETIEEYNRDFDHGN